MDKKCCIKRKNCTDYSEKWPGIIILSVLFIYLAKAMVILFECAKPEVNILRKGKFITWHLLLMFL